MPLTTRLFAAVIALLLFFALRLALLDAVPPFIDEAFLHSTAEAIPANSPLYRSGEGRLFAGWYWFAMQTPHSATFFMGRVANTLVIVLGVAAAMAIAYGITRRLWAIPLTVIVFGFSRYLTFFDAFGNTEPLFTGVMLAVLAVTLRLRSRAHWRDAVVVGALLFIAVGVKLNALPYAFIPVAGVVALKPPGRSWRQQLTWGVVALGVFGVLFGGLLAVQQWRGYDPLFHLLDPSSGGGGAFDSLVPRTLEIAGGLATYGGVVWLSLVLAAMIVLLVRREFYLLLAVGVPFLTLWLAGKYFTRYLYPNMASLLLIAVVGVGYLLPRRTRLAGAVTVMLLAYGAADWYVFTVAMREAPETVLVARDFAEHYAADGSGAGLEAVLAVATERQPERVVGMLANCAALAYMAGDAITVECPRVSPSGEDVEPLAQLAGDLRGQDVLVVLEDIPYVPESIPGMVIATVERPGGLTTLRVIDMAGGAPDV
ncbi:MAG: hypothetical protein AAFV33_01485 [Chloroflexota bacterium]